MGYTVSCPCGFHQTGMDILDAAARLGGHPAAVVVADVEYDVAGLLAEAEQVLR